MIKMANVGFRIRAKIERPAKELIQEFKELPVANIADCMSRFSCIDASIKPVNKARLAGPAFTVKSRTADNLMLHKAIDMAQPGDIIIVDCQGDLVNSVFGEIMAKWAKKRGIGGLIIDGAIRDIEALSEMDMPIYAAGCTPKGPYKDGPGEINTAVCCGGVVVNPGDIVVGDADGVVIIAAKDAPEILKKAKGKLAQETETFIQIDKGTLDRSWVDKTLKEKGCEFLDD